MNHDWPLWGAVLCALLFPTMVAWFLISVHQAERRHRRMLARRPPGKVPPAKARGHALR